MINFGLQSAILKKEIKDELSLSEEDDMFGLICIGDLSDRQMFCSDAINTMNKMRELFDRARTPQQFQIAFKQIKALASKSEHGSS